MTLEEQVKALQTEITNLRQRFDDRVKAEDNMILYIRQSVLAMNNMFELFLDKHPTTSEIRKKYKLDEKTAQIT